jgi:hypothetical protein
MAFAAGADRPAYQADKMVARLFGCSVRAGLVWPTCAVSFSRGNPGEANARAFSAP